MLQIVAFLMLVILITLEVSFILLVSLIMLLENIYSTGVNHNDHHLQASYFYSTGQRLTYKHDDNILELHILCRERIHFILCQFWI
jgi:hypothetical protein